MLLFIALCLCTMSALAAPSISELDQPKDVVMNMETLDAELAAELAGDSIYTSRAALEQYDDKTRALIEKAEQAFGETGTNGHEIAQGIPSVREIFADCQNGNEVTEDWMDLSRLKQLTYMQDFKYTSTGLRVNPNHQNSKPMEFKVLDMEVLKGGKLEDFVIIQVNPETGSYVCLRMKEYDPETGSFVADFPSFGPYMIAQII